MAFPIHLPRTPLLKIVYVFVGRHIAYLQLQLILRATAKKKTRPFLEWVAAAPAPPLLIIATQRLRLIQPRLIDRGATAQPELGRLGQNIIFYLRAEADDRRGPL